MEPTLSHEELAQVAAAALEASAHSDKEGILDAMAPIWEPRGNAGDGWIFTMMMIDVVVEAMPHRSCPEHGSMPLSIQNLSPEFEAAHPGQVAYLRLVAADYNGDIETALAVFCAAAKNGSAPDMLWTAVKAAGTVLRQRRAALQ